MSYVDADKFAEVICESPTIDEHSANAVIFMLRNQPTADVVEVKHGEWEQGDYYDIGDVCSVCQYESRIEPCKYNYCPNCGTKMDGGKAK